MQKNRIIGVVGIAISLGCAGFVAEAPPLGPPIITARPGDDQIETAGRLMTACEELMLAGDARSVDCVADEARIVMRREYPNGRRRTEEMTASDFRLFGLNAIAAMNLTISEEDRAREAIYTDAQTELTEDGDVRVWGTYRMETGPELPNDFELVIGPDLDGDLRILTLKFEMRSE